MNIRFANTLDLDAIRLIYEDAILNSTAVYEYEPFDIHHITNWFEEKQRQKFPVFVLEVDKNIAGFCTYSIFRDRAAYHPSKEHSVYVHPDFRGRGFGSLLLEKIIAQATIDGVHTLIGGIDADNAISIALHHKFGFLEVARIKQVAFKFNRYLDLIFLQKML